MVNKEHRLFLEAQSFAIGNEEAEGLGLRVVGFGIRERKNS